MAQVESDVRSLIEGGAYSAQVQVMVDAIVNVVSDIGAHIQAAMSKLADRYGGGANQEPSEAAADRNRSAKEPEQKYAA